MINRKPFFSIVIPTYNRYQFLSANLNIILAQTFDNFEIIVSDNLSGDKTQQKIKTFTDRRIRYYRNKKNLGFFMNVQTAILRAKGKYIFCLGDDDFILFADTLDHLYKILKEKQYGFIRLNFLERKLSGKELQRVYGSIDNDLIINKSSKSIKIFDFLDKIHIGHIAGLVFKNEKISSKSFLQSEIAPWVKVAFENSRKYGACFLSNFYVVLTLPKLQVIKDAYIYDAYNAIDNDKLMYEHYSDYIFALLKDDEKKDYQKKYYSRFISLLPAVKFYSNNKNLLKFFMRLVTLESSLKFSIKIWLYFIISFIIPKIFWEYVRHIQHQASNKIKNIKNFTKVMERFGYLDRKYYGFLDR